MSWTLTDIRQHLRDLDAEDGSSRAQRVYDRIANDANRALHEAGNWSFDRVKGRLHFPAQATGTCDLSVNGTALTNGSGFTSADAGKHVRLRGEALQYLISAYGSASALTLAEAYRGDSAVSGGAFSLTQDRLALPTRFRSMGDIYLNDWPEPLQFVTLDELLWERMNARECSVPRCYAIEFYATSTQLDAGTSKAPYLWVYPPPSSKRTLDFYYFEWPVEMSNSSDGISAPQPAEKVHREFLRAYLLLEQGKVAEYETQRNAALGFARSSLAQYRVSADAGARESWTPAADGGRRMGRRRMWIGPNEGV